MFLKPMPCTGCLPKSWLKACGCRMTLVDYPLAPEHSYRQTFRMMREAYEKLLDQFPEDSFILMGDSAGGGLALAFAQQLAAENHSRLPVKNVLLSPWLDLSMSNPENEQYVASDHVLTLRMLREAGLKYAAGDDRDQHLLSPIKGKLEGLPPTLVFYSTQELFCADCRKLRKMTEAFGNFQFREYPGMQHDWPILTDSGKAAGHRRYL
jgi:monoterpene epsilon-lactone hydrolase